MSATTAAIPELPSKLSNDPPVGLELDRMQQAAADQLAQITATLRADRPPPEQIRSTTDAAMWLVWAAVHGHQEGCQCRRCPVARRILCTG